MSSTITITAPSRLHFGLYNLGGGAGRQFGGLGLMIEEPHLQLQIEQAGEFHCEGPLSHRVRVFTERWASFHRLPELPRCKLRVLAAPREHTGLGVGTQLAMSVAAGLNAFARLPSQTPVELAASVGRGQRSAVGAYGFALGGLIAERGKLPGEPVSPLDCHLDLPEAWRVVLVIPEGAIGIANEQEVLAFSQLPPVKAEVTDELIRLAREALLPAAAQGDFSGFAQAVFAYGQLAGKCFAPLQGGPYRGPKLAAIIEQLQSLGCVGVGQSSWGPTIFALQPGEDDAQRLVERFAETTDADGCDLRITRIANRGALVDVTG